MGLKYVIEFELPDNKTVLERIGTTYVNWSVWGFSGMGKAKPLKEQEPKSVEVAGKLSTVKYGNCPKCGEGLNDEVNPHWCGFCGQAVKWE